MPHILQRLAKRRLQRRHGARRPATRCSKELAEKARNVGGYAPGELQALVAQGSAVRDRHGGLQPLARTRFAPKLRAKVLKDWGPPEKSQLMTVDDGPPAVRHRPAVQYGNIALHAAAGARLGRGSREDVPRARIWRRRTSTSAAYAWLRNGFKADAVVHVGTHGTLEWLDGKDIGLSEDDASDALIADLPDIYIYNVDVVGEGPGRAPPRHGDARRSHGAAVQEGRPLPELAELSENDQRLRKRQSRQPGAGRDLRGTHPRSRCIDARASPRTSSLKLDGPGSSRGGRCTRSRSTSSR